MATDIKCRYMFCYRVFVVDIVSFVIINMNCYEFIVR